MFTLSLHTHTERLSTNHMYIHVFLHVATHTVQQAYRSTHVHPCTHVWKAQCTHTSTHATHCRVLFHTHHGQDGWHTCTHLPYTHSCAFLTPSLSHTASLTAANAPRLLHTRTLSHTHTPTLTLLGLPRPRRADPPAAHPHSRTPRPALPTPARAMLAPTRTCSHTRPSVTTTRAELSVCAGDGRRTSCCPGCGDRTDGSGEAPSVE